MYTQKERFVSQRTNAPMDVGQEGLAIPRGGGVGVGGDEVREQDRFLPVANIARIMKRARWCGVLLQQEVSEGGLVFVSSRLRCALFFRPHQLRFAHTRPGTRSRISRRTRKVARARASRNR